ncbi:MAG: hypothetical protein P8Y25_10685, partial [Chromatiaceae bacterium]
SSGARGEPVSAASNLGCDCRWIHPENATGESATTGCTAPRVVVGTARNNPYLARLLDLGRSVVVVRQGDQQWTAIRERQIAWRMVPAA